MAGVRPPLRLLTRIQIAQLQPLRQQQQRRSFLASAVSSLFQSQRNPQNQQQKPQVLTASARLPHHHLSVYDRIADIDSYASFLPYCKSARVTEWTALTPTPSPTTPTSTSNEDQQRQSQRRWPARADLTAGWGGFEETYSSRVFCAPALGVVEAVSGAQGRTELSSAELERFGLRDPGPSSSSAGESELFTCLVTRWTVTPVAAPEKAGAGAGTGTARTGGGSGGGGDWTDVRLDIKFLFANPVYGAVSAAVADKLAPVMVRAFVEQAERVLKRQQQQQQQQQQQNQK